MNRRQFITALAAVPFAKYAYATEEPKTLCGALIEWFGGVKENCWREGDVTTYSYDVDVDLITPDRVGGIRRIWADGRLIYGGVDTDLSAEIERWMTVKGEKIELRSFPIGPFGNRFPPLAVER